MKYINVCIYMCVCVCVCEYMYINMWVCVCVCEYICVHIYVYVCVNIYIYMYICVCVCVYIYIYIKEQTEYIQNQIDNIRDSVEDRQSRIAWQTINEVSRRKNTAKAKLKAANQQERIKLWKQHFENLLGNPPKITHEPITRIISKQLDIKLGPFTQEELDSVLRKIKNRKAAGLDEIPPEVWKTRQFDDILLRHCNAVYNQNPIDRWTKGCILPFPKKGVLGLAKNYRGINTYIHSCQNLQGPTTKPNRTQNRQHT